MSKVDGTLLQTDNPPYGLMYPITDLLFKEVSQSTFSWMLDYRDNRTLETEFPEGSFWGTELNIPSENFKSVRLDDIAKMAEKTSAYLDRYIFDWAKSVAVVRGSEPLPDSGYVYMHPLTLETVFPTCGAEIFLTCDLEPGIVIAFPDLDRVAKVLIGFNLIPYPHKDDVAKNGHFVGVSTIRGVPVENPRVEIYHLKAEE